MTPSVITPSATAATPLMQQYLSLKAKYPNEILFFRLGDFYEMFYEDAIKASPLLEVTLTKRQTIPMCGVPHHAATGYMSKLLKAGVSVAVAEQMEDPKKTKGMVKREVVRVVTPGTILEDELLQAKSNNFLVAIACSKKGSAATGEWALVAADISTGRQWAGEVKGDSHFSILKSQLAALNPSEILLIGEASTLLSDLNSRAVIRFEPVPAQASSLELQARAALNYYLTRDRCGAVPQLLEPQPLPLESAGILFLDETAIRHLELVESSDPSRNGPTLLALLDRCVTSMGSRLLRWWVLHPSTQKKNIDERLDQVDGLVSSALAREELRTHLREVADLERISVRTQAETASPRDLAALRASLLKIPFLQETLDKIKAEALKNPYSKIEKFLTVPDELVRILSEQLVDEPPARLIDGGVIKEGFNSDLDELRLLRRHGKKWIAEMEAQEREKTGIGSLKVGYNDIFGYFLEVSKTNIPKVPSNWIRKQTLANAERYITPALKEQEEKILGAEERIRQIEATLFQELIHQTAAFAPTLSHLAEGVSQLDALASLAEAAAENRYIRPTIFETDHLDIKAGRHPVIEKEIGRDRFIPNDVKMSSDGERIVIITGPNMAGKSTYLRQTALIIILAQMGSFVPAQSAEIGIVDKIFTRIGAADRLSQGQSTFMVEMQEVASLLLHSTKKSFLVLDEVGRGTSTYDGVSIAWAVVDHLADGPRTLFATHYFELTQLAEKLPGVVNAHATAKEWTTPDGKKQVVFLYQILPGPADRSYGIHVAEMAGLPQSCIERSREILKLLESGSHNLSRVEQNGKPVNQLELFGSHPIVAELMELNVDKMTPLEALNKLEELKNKL